MPLKMRPRFVGTSVALAFFMYEAKEGIAMLASTPMMHTTIISSMSVKAALAVRG